MEETELKKSQQPVYASMIGVGLFGLVLLGVVSLVAAFIDTNTRNDFTLFALLASSFVALIAFVAVIQVWARSRNTHYILSPSGLQITRTSTFGGTKKRLVGFGMVTSLRVKQSPLAVRGGYGDIIITIDTNNTSEDIVLKNVIDPTHALSLLAERSKLSST